MTLPRLNPQGPQFVHARGINPPIVRAALHIGFAVAQSGEEMGDWETVRENCRGEVREAHDHLVQSQVQGFDATPFVSPAAIRHMNEIQDQFQTLIDELEDPGMTRNQAYENLAMLADNLTYISAVAENYVIGNGADEGQNP